MGSADHLQNGGGGQRRGRGADAKMRWSGLWLARLVGEHGVDERLGRPPAVRYRTTTVRRTWALDYPTPGRLLTATGSGMMTTAQRTPVVAGRYPSELVRDVRTANGAVVQCRPIRPDDAAKLVAFHSALSAQSVYLRFFSFHPVLTAREIERFTHVDYVDRLALVVEHRTRLIAVGRFDRVPGTRTAEVAFVVDDDFQHQGIGTLLCDELAAAAWVRGIDEFVADTLAENSGMIELFHGIGFPVRSSYEGGVVRVRFRIEPVPEYVAALQRREARRRVAEPDGPGSRPTDVGLPDVRPARSGTPATYPPTSRSAVAKERA